MPRPTIPIQEPIDNSPELEALLYMTKEQGETQENLLETSIIQNEKNAKEVKETIEKGSETVAKAVEELAPTIKKIEEPISVMAKFLQDMKGEKGERGDDGKTPEKGTDYFTPEEVEEFKTDIQSKIRVPEDGKNGSDGRDGRDGRDGQDGRDGEDAEVDYESVIQTILSKIDKPKDGKNGKDGKDAKRLTAEQIVELIRNKFSYDDLKNKPIFHPSSRDYDLVELKDVQITEPTDGQVLVYDATLHKWKNGSGGSGSTINFADEEEPAGAIDDVNVTFTLAHTPTAGSLKLYLGSRLKRGTDYSLSGNIITMFSAPLAGSTLIADYRY